jgi:hypothetical protein
MEPVKIFDREYIIKYTDYEKGLINIDSICGYEIIDNIKVYDVIQEIINAYITHNEQFEILMCMASKLLGIDKNDMVMWNYSKKGSGWMLHPILIKSALRHIELMISSKKILAGLIYGFKQIGINTINSCTLLSIVDKVSHPYYIEGKEYGFLKKKEYKCAGILDKNDMFNDDILVHLCTKQIIAQTLIILIPKCLGDIIILYVYL